MRMTTKGQAAAFDATLLSTIVGALSWAGVGPDALEEGVTIETKYGPAYFHLQPSEKYTGREYLPGWLHVRFENVAEAKRELWIDGGSRLNPYSGKWNWHDVETDVERAHCARALRRLQPLPISAVA